MIGKDSAARWWVRGRPRAVGALLLGKHSSRRSSPDRMAVQECMETVVAPPHLPRASSRVHSDRQWMCACATPGEAGDGDSQMRSSARSSTGTRAVEFTAACDNRRQTSGWWRGEQRSTTKGNGQPQNRGQENEPAAGEDTGTPPSEQHVGSAEARVASISGATRA